MRSEHIGFAGHVFLYDVRKNGSLAVVTPRSVRPRLLGVQDATVKDALGDTGIVLFRGFETAPESFHAFASRFASRFFFMPVADRASHPLAKELQTVTTGQFALNLHFENGNTPMRPDLLWFYCVRPAIADGETLVCDGVALWEALRPEAQRFFLEHEIVHRNTFPERLWRSVSGFGKEGDPLPEMTVLDIGPGTRCRLNPDRSMSIEYRTSAVGSSRFARDRRGFVGNVLPDVYADDPLPVLEDGSPLPEAVIREVDETAAGLTSRITWKAGDVLVIDNTRWLHGRRAFEDPARTILMLCAVAN